MEIFELNACRGHHVLLMVAVILIAENSTGIAAGELMVDTWSTDNFWTETVTADSTTNRMSSMNNESALVLIQQPDEAIVKPENIKEQFQRFINAYDIDLGGVSIDFDVGKGELFYNENIYTWNIYKQHILSNHAYKASLNLSKQPHNMFHNVRIYSSKRRTHILV